MKTLASCTPTEFLKQTNLIRKSVAHWLDITGIMEIRKRKPELTVLTHNMSDEERRQAFEDNKRKSEDMIRKNFWDLLEIILEKHPDETLEVLSLVCFIDPKDADNHKVGEYLNALTEIMNDDAVIGFFSSLASLGSVSTASTSGQ